MNGTSSWKKRQGFDMKKMDGWMVTERIDSYERMGTVHLLKKKRQGFDEWYICLKIRFIKNVCVCVCVCVCVGVSVSVQFSKNVLCNISPISKSILFKFGNVILLT